LRLPSRVKNFDPLDRLYNAEGDAYFNMTSRSWKRFVAPVALVTVAVVVSLVLVLSVVHAIRNDRNDDLEQLVALAKGFAWPAAIVIIVAFFEEPIRAFLDRLSKITFKAGDAETTLEAVAKASALVGAAEAAATSANGVPQNEDTTSFAASATNVARVISAAHSGDLKARVLWVDDHPENNRYLIGAFKELGIAVDTAISTEAALGMLVYNSYDVVITDMGRPPDMEAGYTLLVALRERGVYPPLIIYAGSDSVEHRQRALAAGAMESTNRPQRVFDLVINIVASRISRLGL
jgi:CheY-like chemotaxis protein